MTQDDFIFAVVPPVLAIALQLFTFPADRTIDRAADQLKGRYGISDIVAKGVAELAKGAVTIAGVAPTFVSLALTICVLSREENNAPLFVVIALTFTIILVLLVLNVSTKRSIYEVQTTKIPLPIKIGPIRDHGPYYTFGISFAQGLHIFVYAVNLLVLGLTFLVYKKWI